MKDLQICLPTFSTRNITQGILLTFLLASLSLIALAQQRQQRGLYPTGTFQVSDIDIIDNCPRQHEYEVPAGIAAAWPRRGACRIHLLFQQQAL
jgi:hypothetical protein